MGHELADAIALCTTWSDGDTKTWALLAQEAIAGDPISVLGQLSHLAVQMAKAIASQAGGGSDVADVLSHLALDAEQDSGDTGT